MQYWLIKSEPDAYSIDDLARDGVEHWDGIRNYQARNFMRDEMQIGDKVLFYHSNATPPGVVGLAEVASAPYVDHTQFDAQEKYYDPKSDPENPRWIMVDMAFVEKLPRMVTLEEIKEDVFFADMKLVARGQRLSIQPVEKKHYERIVRMARERSS